MSPKRVISLGLLVGSGIGGYLPSLFGVSIFSFISIITTAIGGGIGAYLAYQLVKDLL